MQNWDKLVADHGKLLQWRAVSKTYLIEDLPIHNVENKLFILVTDFVGVCFYCWESVFSFEYGV